ncbi:FkbM family methyltransferase [Novosphingobium sp.]|uniref:FkbM family methyltransferase n=1 Tax=Novosphingobium sp. TaxID=1874826 RepID=UPI0035AE15CA
MLRDFIRETGVKSWVWRQLQRQFHKRILRRTHFLRLPTGNRIGLPPDSSFASEVFITRANVDWGCEALFCRMIVGQGAFMDVGANIGYYSLYMEPFVEQVFAFEPDARACSQLIANVGGLSQISVISCAVGKETGTATFVQSPRSEISHLGREGETGVEMPVVSIDDFVAERGVRVGGIKTDIEGRDLDALIGARKVLQRERPVVLAELQPCPELAELARNIDYAIFAYAREPVSRAVRFVRVDALEARGLVFKMLFLVPSERADEIRQAA